MGGEARQTALWHHLDGSHKGSRRDRARWIGRLPFLARHSAECADQICKELPRGTRRIGRTGLERQHPCKPFTVNLARDISRTLQMVSF